MLFIFIFAKYPSIYLLHRVAFQHCVPMLEMFPIEIVTLRNLFFDLCLYLEDVFFGESPGSGLILFSKNAYIISAFKSTL